MHADLQEMWDAAKERRLLRNQRKAMVQASATWADDGMGKVDSAKDREDASLPGGAGAGAASGNASGDAAAAAVDEAGKPARTRCYQRCWKVS